MIESINHVSRQVAKELGLDETLVKQVNMYFWKEVRSQISSGKHTTVWLRGLGTLTVSRFKLRERIKKLIRNIRYLRKEESVCHDNKRTKECVLNDKIAELKLMLERRNELAVQYKANEDKARAKRRAKLLKTSMDQQTSDPAGNSQQTI